MFLKDYLIRQCNKLDQSYWALKPRKRRIVGWSALLISAILIITGGYQFYNLGKYLGQLCQGAWTTVTEGEEQEEEFVNADEWTYEGKHREFHVQEKNPKRNVKLSRDFNDINDTQLAAAKRLGIHPLKSRDDLPSVRSRLVELKETRYYLVDPLTHSIPYLVPDAADFLTALG